MRLQAVSSSLLLATLAGCVSLDPAQDIARTAATVSTRSGVPLQWQASADERRAQTARLIGPRLSAPHAVEIAFINSPRVAMLLDDIGIARAERVQAGLLRNPVLDAAQLKPRDGGGSQLDLGIGLDFLSVLTLPTRLRLAAQDFDTTRLRVTDDLLQFAGEVRASYIDAVAARQLAAALAQSVAAYDASAELAYRLNRAGNLNAAKRDRELLAWQAARRMQAAATVRADALRETLQLQLGLDTPLAPDALPDTLPPLPQDEIALSDLAQRAGAASLGLQRRRAALEAQARRMGIERATAVLPELHGGYGWEREAHGGEWRQGPSLGLTLPLFDFGSAQRARNLARMRQMQQAMLLQQRTLAANARIASERLTQARAAVEQYEQVLLPLAARVVDASQMQYNAMQVSSFELLADRRRELEVEQAHIEALRDYWQARVAIDGLLAGAAPAALVLPATPLAANATNATGGH